MISLRLSVFGFWCLFSDRSTVCGVMFDASGVYVIQLVIKIGHLSMNFFTHLVTDVHRENMAQMFGRKLYIDQCRSALYVDQLSLVLYVHRC